MGRIASFRGLIADGSIEVINLHTNDGKTGYKIKKFEMLPDNPGTSDVEHTIKIFSVLQTGATTNAIDFSDNTLLAAGYLVDSNSVGNTSYLSTIFDNMIFNQDIYITHKEALDTQPCNYYIELEFVNLTLDEQTVATLKDVRNNKVPS